MAEKLQEDDKKVVEDSSGTVREAPIQRDDPEFDETRAVGDEMSDRQPAHTTRSTDVGTALDRVRYCVETISTGFEHWDTPHVKGPGLYFVLEGDPIAEFTEPIGTNRWPVEDCPSVFADIETLIETARSVAYTCDGAVVVHDDGTIEEQMVRIKQLSSAEAVQPDDLPYAGWMGARHMSALETSTREAVSAAITLSEEDGRMTLFTDGTFEDHHRDAFPDGWQPSD